MMDGKLKINRFKIKQMKKIITLILIAVFFSINIHSQEKESVPFVIADVPPQFIDLNKETLQHLFNNKISDFFNKNFNNSVAKNLGLTGTQRVIISFKILVNGDVEVISIKAPHINLENEAIRVVQKLPKMIPGMYKGEFVDIKYSIPIAFKTY